MPPCGDHEAAVGRRKRTDRGERQVQKLKDSYNRTSPRPRLLRQDGLPTYEPQRVPQRALRPAHGGHHESVIFSRRITTMARDASEQSTQNVHVSPRRNSSTTAPALGCNILSDRRLRCDGGVVEKASNPYLIGKLLLVQHPRQPGSNRRGNRGVAQGQRETERGEVSAFISASSRCEPSRWWCSSHPHVTQSAEGSHRAIPVR